MCPKGQGQRERFTAVLSRRTTEEVEIYALGDEDKQSKETRLNKLTLYNKQENRKDTLMTSKLTDKQKGLLGRCNRYGKNKYIKYFVKSIYSNVGLQKYKNKVYERLKHY